MNKVSPVPPVEPSSRAQAEGSLPFESLRALSLSNGQVERQIALHVTVAMNLQDTLLGQPLNPGARASGTG